MELTNREIASAILFGLFAVWALVAPGKGPNVGQALFALLRLFAHWKILVPLALFLGWCAGLVVLAHEVGLWRMSMIKDTIVLVAGSALPGVYYAVRAKGVSDIVKRALRSVLGLTALLSAYVNLASGPLWAELLVQSLAFVTVGVGAVAGSRSEFARVAMIAQATAVLIGAGLIIFTFVSLVAGPADLDWTRESRTFAMSVWLPFLSVPFVYVFALVTATEMALLRLKWGNGKAKPPLRVRAAMVMGFRGRLLYANRFGALWPNKVGRSTTLRDARRAMGDYREAVRAQDRERERRVLASVANTGKVGYDAAGRWLDRREFDETKDVLESIALFQRARARGGAKGRSPMRSARCFCLTTETNSRETMASAWFVPMMGPNGARGDQLQVASSWP